MAFCLKTWFKPFSDHSKWHQTSLIHPFRFIAAVRSDRFCSLEGPTPYALIKTSSITSTDQDLYCIPIILPAVKHTWPRKRLQPAARGDRKPDAVDKLRWNGLLLPTRGYFVDSWWSKRLREPDLGGGVLHSNWCCDGLLPSSRSFTRPVYLHQGRFARPHKSSSARRKLFHSRRLAFKKSPDHLSASGRPLRRGKPSHWASFHPTTGRACFQ